MLSNDVNYRITIEPSTPSIELLLVFLKKTYHLQLHQLGLEQCLVKKH